MTFSQIDYLDSVASTNDYLKAFVNEGKGRIAVAREQTGGKGQYGRSWYSPAGQGLYASYLLYPALRAKDSARLNQISSLAVVSTLLDLDRKLPITVKPPNDVVINGRKVAGILTELASWRERISWAIIGIGVNLSQRQFPPHLAPIATSLRMEGLDVPSRLEFLDRLTDSLLRHLDQLEIGWGEALETRYQRFVAGGRLPVES